MSTEDSKIEALIGQSRLTVGLGWQPIETAPKDETRILTVIVGFHIAIGWWFAEEEKWMTTDAEDYADEGSWVEAVRDSYYHPTHWMPLPEAPNVKVTGSPVLSPCTS